MPPRRRPRFRYAPRGGTNVQATRHDGTHLLASHIVDRERRANRGPRCVVRHKRVRLRRPRFARAAAAGGGTHVRHDVPRAAAAAHQRSLPQLVASGFAGRRFRYAPRPRRRMLCLLSRCRRRLRRSRILSLVWFASRPGPNQPDPNRNAGKPGPEKTAISRGVSNNIHPFMEGGC